MVTALSPKSKRESIHIRISSDAKEIIEKGHHRIRTKFDGFCNAFAV